MADNNWRNINTQNQVDDFFNRHSDQLQQLQPDGMPQQESGGFLDAIGRGLKGGGAGVLQGQAQLGNLLGVGDGATANYFGEATQNAARKKEYTIGDMLPFASDYWTNPEGATYDIANMAGSAGTLGAETAAIATGAGLIGGALGIGGAAAAGAGASAAARGASMGANAVGRLAGAMSKVASKHGYTKLAKVLDGPMGQLYALNIMKTPLEVSSEAGNAGAEALENGADISEARRQAAIVAATQMPVLALSNTLESAGLGGLVGKKLGKNAMIDVLGSITREGLQNAWEEGFQQSTHEYAQGTQGFTGMFNPFEWSDEAKQQAAAGAVGGFAIGGGNAMGSTMFGKNNQQNADEAQADATADAARKLNGEATDATEAIANEQGEEQPQQAVDSSVVEQAQQFLESKYNEVDDATKDAINNASTDDNATVQLAQQLGWQPQQAQTEQQQTPAPATPAAQAEQAAQAANAGIEAVTTGQQPQTAPIAQNQNNVKNAQQTPIQQAPTPNVDNLAAEQQAGIAADAVPQQPTQPQVSPAEWAVQKRNELERAIVDKNHDSKYVKNGRFDFGKLRNENAVRGFVSSNPNLVETANRALQGDEEARKELGKQTHTRQMALLDAAQNGAEVYGLTEKQLNDYKDNVQKQKNATIERNAKDKLRKFKKANESNLPLDAIQEINHAIDHGNIANVVEVANKHGVKLTDNEKALANGVTPVARKTQTNTAVKADGKLKSVETPLSEDGKVVEKNGKVLLRRKAAEYTKEQKTRLNDVGVYYNSGYSAYAGEATEDAIRVAKEVNDEINNGVIINSQPQGEVKDNVHSSQEQLQNKDADHGTEDKPSGDTARKQTGEVETDDKGAGKNGEVKEEVVEEPKEPKTDVQTSAQPKTNTAAKKATKHYPKAHEFVGRDYVDPTTGHDMFINGISSDAYTQMYSVEEDLGNGKTKARKIPVEDVMPLLTGEVESGNKNKKTSVKPDVKIDEIPKYKEGYYLVRNGDETKAVLAKHKGEENAITNTLKGGFKSVIKSTPADVATEIRKQNDAMMNSKIDTIEKEFHAYLKENDGNASAEKLQEFKAQLDELKTAYKDAKMGLDENRKKTISRFDTDFMSKENGRLALLGGEINVEIKFAKDSENRSGEILADEIPEESQAPATPEPTTPAPKTTTPAITEEERQALRDKRQKEFEKKVKAKGNAKDVNSSFKEQVEKLKTTINDILKAMQLSEFFKERGTEQFGELNKQFQDDLSIPYSNYSDEQKAIIADMSRLVVAENRLGLTYTNVATQADSAKSDLTKVKNGQGVSLLRIEKSLHGKNPAIKDNLKEETLADIIETMLESADAVVKETFGRQLKPQKFALALKADYATRNLPLSDKKKSTQVMGTIETLTDGQREAINKFANDIFKVIETAENNFKERERLNKAIDKYEKQVFDKLSETDRTFAEHIRDIEITHRKFSADDIEAIKRSFDDIEAEIRSALPNARLHKRGKYIVALLGNGKKIAVGINDQIIVNESEREQAAKDHGVDGDVQIQGYWQKVGMKDLDGFINISRNSEVGTAYHEVLHMAIDLALSERERNALCKQAQARAEREGRDVEEALADTYKEWALKRQANRKTAGALGKIWQKIQDFVRQMQVALGATETADDIFKRIESGEAFYNSNENEHTFNAENEAIRKKTRFSVSKDDISSFVEEALTKKENTKSLRLGRVFKWVADEIKEETGLDVRGYTQYITPSDARHQNNRHGEKQTDPNKVPLDKEGIVRALDVLKCPDWVTEGNIHEDSGNPTVKMYMVQEDGTYVVTEVVASKQKKLIVKTMWKEPFAYKKETQPTLNHAADDGNPHHTSNNESGANVSVQTGATPSAFSDIVAQNDEKNNESYRSTRKYSAAPTGNAVSRTYTNTRHDNETYNSVEEEVAATVHQRKPKGWVAKGKDFVKDNFKNFYRNWIDKNVDLRKFDEAFEKTGGKLAGAYDSLRARVQFITNNTMGAVDTLVNGDERSMKLIMDKYKLKHNVTFKGILDDLHKSVGGSFDSYLQSKFANDYADSKEDAANHALSSYLVAQQEIEGEDIHKKKYVEQLKKWRENGSKGERPKYEPYKYSGGLTRAKCQAFVNNAPKEIRHAAEQYYKYNENLLDILKNGNMLTQEAYNEIKNTWKHYCPLIRDFEDTEAVDSLIAQFKGGGKGAVNVANGLKRRRSEGSMRDVISPLESTINATANIVARVERNKVGVLMVDRAKQTGIPEFAQRVEGDSADAKNCIFTVMRNGKKEAYKTLPEFYPAITHSYDPAIKIQAAFFTAPAKMLRWGSTSSPSFAVRNFVRDTIFAGISSKNGFIPIVDSIRGAWELYNNPDFRSTFKASGVISSAFYGDNDSIIEAIDEMNGGKPFRPYNPVDLFKGGIHILEGFNNAIEASTRAGEFLRAQKKGKSLEECMHDAVEVTLNFNRSGLEGQQFNKVVPFFNAAIQGGDKMYRLLRDNPAVTSLKLATYIIIPSMVLWAMNHDDDWYKELDPNIKNTCWVFGTKENQFRIPKPQEAGILFGSGVERMLDAAYGQDPKAMESWREAFLDAMIPSFIPTVILPMIEWNSNYSFFRGKQVVNQAQQKLPDAMQYGSYTSEASKFIGKYTDKSPLKIDNLIRSVSGTLGMAAWQSFDLFAAEKQNLPAKLVSEQAVIRDFMISENNKNRIMNDMYELKANADKYHNAYGKKGKPSKDVQAVNAAYRMISKIAMEKRDITNTDKMNSLQKRAAIDKLNLKQKQIAEKCIKKYGNKFDV